MARRGRAGAAARESSTTASSSDDGDQDYLDSLTRAQALEIDAAFDEFAGDEGQQRAAKRRKTGSGSNGTKGDSKGKGKAKAQDEDTAMAGGFILEDDEAADAMGGGFLPEEDDDDDAGPSGPSSFQKNDDNASKPGYILLESIPSALELLGLDGDDPSILSIFENASEEGDDGNSIVKRKNFMRVTAILVTQRDEDRELDAKSRKAASAGKKVHSGGGRRRAVRLDVDEDMDEHDDSDPLVLSSDEEDEEDPDNEDSDPWADEDGLDEAFGRGREPSPASKRRTTRSVADSSKLASLPSGSSPPAPPSGSKAKIKGKSRAEEVVPERKLKLSSKQEEECERMFQQFFQSTDKSKNRSISIDEIRYVATLLNEKLSDADAIEMLEYATSTKDKRVNLDAFSRIMVDCKAV